MTPPPNPEHARFNAAVRLEQAAGHVRELESCGRTPSNTEIHAVIDARRDWDHANR